MCRYGVMTYKPHYACFACRKVFRRPLLADIREGGPDRPFRCPQCAGPMADMGYDFAAPKRSDEKAWRVAASLFEAGETFYSCGCTGPGYRPRDPHALRQFLAARLDEFEAHAMSKTECYVQETTPRKKIVWRRRTPDEALTYWNSCAARVRAALDRL